MSLWAEGNTRPETPARAEKLRDKVSAVTSFFDFSGKDPTEVSPDDIARWRAGMERRGFKPATVYARVSRISAFFRWLMPTRNTIASSRRTRRRRPARATRAPTSPNPRRRSQTKR